MKNKQINFFFFILIIILIINCFYSTANLLTNKKVMGKQIGSNLNPEGQKIKNIFIRLNS